MDGLNKMKTIILILLLNTAYCVTLRSLITDLPGIRRCHPDDLDCKINAEYCLETCQVREAPLLAKCTTAAAMAGPVLKGINLK